MNSDDTPRSGVNKDSLPSSSQISNPDTNANLRPTTDESKGAIPKTRLSKTAPKKTNNNVDDTNLLTIDGLKINGFSRSNSTSNNFLSNTYVEYSPPNVQSMKEENNSILEQSPLNIPVQNDFVNGPYLPVNNCSELENLSEACAICQERNTKDDSSSEENELLSISDDGCIYTYKGDQVADLPSSFYNLEIPPLDEAPVEGREENSSPEMDFLEMDFDPGPSGDADSDSVSNAEIDNAASLPVDDCNPEELVAEEEPKPCCSKDLNYEIQPETSNINKQENTTKNTFLNLTKAIPEPIKEPVIAPKAEIKMPWSCTISERTRAAKTLRVIKRHHSSRGELSSPSETGLNGDINLTNLTSFHNATGKISVDDKSSVTSDVERTMIWSHHEACLKQITQVGPSACGATAVLNVLNALRFPIPTLERVQECVSTRLRANSSPLTEYLISRSKAGCTHRDLIAGLYKLSDKKLYARFFAMYPERLVNLQSWLGYWIKHGAVPVATLNLQKCEGNVPDSWHHQMIFGVGPEGIYLTNPLECVDANQLWPQLCSESVLLIRTEDVIARWNPKVDLPELMRINDVRWKELNVVGQIAKVVRESRREARVDYVFRSHIRIPAEYKAGITLVIDIDNPAFTLLRQCPELPLLQPEASASAF